MAEEKHIIKKAIVEIYVPSANSAMDLQNKTMSFFKEKICPLIEKIVAKYSNEGETIRIDKLELDFENFNPQNSNDTELRKLEQQIEEKLVKLITEEQKNNFSGETVTDVKKIPKEKADEELFIHLLRTGSLPWWAKTEQSISLEALAQKILAKSSGSIIKELSAAIRISAVRKRVANKLSSESVEKIIALAFSSSADFLKYVREILNVTKDDFPFSENIRKELYEYILKYPVSSSYTMQLFIAGFIKEKNDLSLAEKLYKLSNINSSDKTAETIKQGIADTDEHFSNQIKKMFNVKDVKLFFSSEENNEVKEKTVTEQKTNVLRPNNKKDLINEEDFSHEQIELYEETGDYFIKNSGMIILAPYLSALFTELDLCDGKTFISEEAKERAVYLLQYLATGKEEDFEEHEMVLNKILCGVEIGAPLTLQFIISEKEKEECLGLLQAVATNWPALKGTSGEGMRDTFFMRDGILEQQSNGWNLKIEKTTIDILLDKLPWGISILQMPWSKEMIFVEW